MTKLEPKIDQNIKKNKECKFQNIRGDLIILGFTGSLGSGCSFLSEGIARKRKFLHCELSGIIKRFRKKSSNTISELQKYGNAMRAQFGDSILAYTCMKYIDENYYVKPNDYPKGVVISGIRNSGEVAFLRSFPNFFLFSVHAEKEVRKQRLKKMTKIIDDENFEEIDNIDSEQDFSFGQQVKTCNYLSDIIVNNSVNVAKVKKDTYINNKIIEKYVKLIEDHLDNKKPSTSPSVDEVFMTAAYCESMRSHCIKRKVGAIIARVTDQKGYIVSSGHNNVPPQVDDCINDVEIEGCFRDKLYKEISIKIKYCPKCGHKFNKDESDENHNKSLMACPRCRINVIKNYIKDPTSGRLLDMCRSLHAEENALMNLLKNSSSVYNDTTLYTTTFPCNLCANKIAEVGIKKVIYAEPYPQEEAKKVLNNNQIACEMFEGVKSAAFFKFFD